MKYLTILLFLFSCTKNYEVKTQNGIDYGEMIYSEIEDIVEVPWKVGLKREEEVSKGVRFYLSVPQLKEGSIDLLRKKYGIDGWIYRFRSIKRGATSTLDHFFVLFDNITRTTKNLSVSLYYQAAAISKQFRFFHCPAFNHRYQIGSFGVDPRSDGEEANLYIRPRGRVRAHTKRFRFSPMILAGGLNLTGRYVIDIAFYNSRTKERYSKWHPINGVVNIQSEIKKVVTSCIGIKEENNPLPSSKVPNLKDFEIK